MKTYFALLFIFCSIYLTPQPIAADPVSVWVDRVRHCEFAGAQNICAGGSVANPKFPEWDFHGVSNDNQLEVYLSIVHQPPKEDVKRVVFISAGQQSENPLARATYGDLLAYGAGYENILTGQPNNYKSNCDDATTGCWRSLKPKSLAVRLMESGLFDSTDTLFILALDARFGYARPDHKKQNIENAYWDFLTSKFSPENLEVMVLAGQSRGGCLMFRLGERLRKSAMYRDIPLVIQGYDPVCVNPEKSPNGVQPEFPYRNPKQSDTTSLSTFTAPNPADEDKKVYALQMGTIFPEALRQDLRILDIHGGGKSPTNKIRPFSWYADDIDLGWWKQKWFNVEHISMGAGTSWAAEEISNLGYGHIYNFVRYDLGRPPARAFQATPRFPVDINGDRLSDVVLSFAHHSDGLVVRSKISNGDGSYDHVADVLGDTACGDAEIELLPAQVNDDAYTDFVNLCQHPEKGLLIRSKIGVGDGTFTSHEFESKDGSAILDMEPYIGDVNGDGLSDVILRWQHPQNGLRIRTKFSQGDGTFVATEFAATDGNLGPHQRAHVGDVNGDKKTDLIYMFKPAGNQDLMIRTRISNGDGTFGFSQHAPVKWINWDNLQSFVVDVNRDKKTDILLLSLDLEGRLMARVFISNGDGTFRFESDDFPESLEVDHLEAIVADVNGDQRTDIILREQHATQGLIFHIKLSDGNGKFTPVSVNTADGPAVNTLPMLSGNFDTGRRADLLLRWRNDTTGLNLRTKFSDYQANLSHTNFEAGDGAAVDIHKALTGPMFWDGGATFKVHPLGDGTAPVLAVPDRLKKR